MNFNFFSFWHSNLHFCVHLVLNHSIKVKEQTCIKPSCQRDFCKGPHAEVKIWLEMFMKPPTIRSSKLDCLRRARGKEFMRCSFEETRLWGQMKRIWSNWSLVKVREWRTEAKEKKRKEMDERRKYKNREES